VFRGEWIAPASVTTPATTEADAMHVLRVPRAADGATERLARRFTSSSSSAPERADRRGVRTGAQQPGGNCRGRERSKIEAARSRAASCRIVRFPQLDMRASTGDAAAEPSEQGRAYRPVQLTL